MNREDYLDFWHRETENFLYCNFFCFTYLLTDFLILSHHYVVNAAYLKGWAHLSLPLVVNTVYSTWMSIKSMQLVTS